MSKLRKSASFRSRIPISKNPSMRSRHNEDYENIKKSPYNLKHNKSCDFKSHRSNHTNQERTFVKEKKVIASHHHLYSSYTSSDESSESPLTQRKHFNLCDIKLSADNLLCLSTDAISLDGLLDTISCDSNFSNPFSPEQYQNVPVKMATSNASYESLYTYKSYDGTEPKTRLNQLNQTNVKPVQSTTNITTLVWGNGNDKDARNTYRCHIERQPKQQQQYQQQQRQYINNEDYNKKSNNNITWYEQHTASLPRPPSTSETFFHKTLNTTDTLYEQPKDALNKKIVRTTIRNINQNGAKNTPPYNAPPSYATFQSNCSEMMNKMSTISLKDNAETLTDLNQNNQNNQQQQLPLQVCQTGIEKINTYNLQQNEKKFLRFTNQITESTTDTVMLSGKNLPCRQKFNSQRMKSEHFSLPPPIRKRNTNNGAIQQSYYETVSTQQQTDIESVYGQKFDVKASGSGNPLALKSITDNENDIENDIENENDTNDRSNDGLMRVNDGRKFDLSSFKPSHRQIQLRLKQNPLTKQLFGVIQEEVFQGRSTGYRNDCELSGSYTSLQCPSPPRPPMAISEIQKDPQIRLSNYLRNVYQELAFKEPPLPNWSLPITSGTLCPARLEMDLRLNSYSHGYSDYITIDQLLTSLQTKDGSFLEAPRRCLIECPIWASRSQLCLRILHAWAKEPSWPATSPVALTLLIPLFEIKRSFAHYIEKEFLPKGPLNPFNNISNGFLTMWNSLEALGSKLLIILDGYISQKNCNVFSNHVTQSKKYRTPNTLTTFSNNKSQYPSDVHDLLDGKLFPEARIIIVTNSTNCTELMSIVQRHVMFEGLTWGRSASILGGGRWGGLLRLVDTVQENKYLRHIAKTPLGCLAIASIYETIDNQFSTDELDVIETIFNCVAPNVLTSLVSELGRLALFCLKMKRTFITTAEIKMYCSYPENILGCLDKNVLYGKTANKKAEYIFHPICQGMLEYLAANYIISLASRPGLLSAEITGMAIGDELDSDLLKVLKFSMTLLGEQAHILLSKLTPLWLSPQTVFMLALSGGHSELNMVALCDILGISKHPPISPLETKPLWVQVRSAPNDLMGWGMALKSSTCTLKNLEVIYQLEKQNLYETRRAIEIFLESISLNESVSTLRLSSLIETEVKDTEINYLAGCISKLLLKPRLENFELVLTLIEEDPPMLKLQSVVTEICRTIRRPTKLHSLLLDLGLCTSQLVQLCGALEKCPSLTRLSLPHLRCERGAISTLSSLLNSKPISFLFLPSCWGVRDDPPSSSGVSMGSGSGSSTGTSCLIKQGSLPGAPSPRTYAPGVFSSLPRGMYVPQAPLGRSATLPRQPLDQTSEKRSCDSVVSKTWYPTPCCEGVPHNSGTLHDLFATIRDTCSKLHGLDLSKAQLSLEDSMCLGETVRVSNTLHTLKLEGSSRFSELLPSILGASESPCLQMLSIGSQRLNLDDSIIVICARALTSCSTLRLLSIDGWCMRIEHAQTLSILRAFLSLTSIRELSLANCRIQTTLIKSDAKVLPIYECRSIVVLKMAGAQITLPDLTVFRGPQLLQFIGGFSCLRELDLSAPIRSGIENIHASLLIVDDKCIIQFFQNVHSFFRLLNTLKICNWVIHFDEMPKTLKLISKATRNSSISHLKIDGISVLDRPKKKRSEAAFIHSLITSMPNLRWMGISLSGKNEDQIAAIGNAVLDIKGTEIEIKLSESTIDQAKLIAQIISLDGKFDIKVSTFGTSSGILIHAEKSGLKSLTRKTKDKEYNF